MSKLSIVAAAAIGSLAAAPAYAQARLALAPCRLPRWTEDVRCGVDSVYENRATGRGRKIALRVVVEPAVHAAEHATPIFYFSGGPGQSPVDVANGVPPQFLGDLREDHDLVFIDRRGTGRVAGLNCPLYGNPPRLSEYFVGTFSLDAVAACRSSLAQRADLDLYSTALASADVDDIRRALGYDRIDLYGGSYGTTSELDYIRRYGSHVRSATMIGVAPPENFFPLPFSHGTQVAMDTLLADCERDRACSTAYPNFRAQFDSLLVRLARAPITASVTDPATHQPTQVTITRDGFAEHVRVMLYAEQFASVMPLIIRDAAAGHWDRFVALGYAVYKGTDDQIARGLQFSVVCAEAMPGLDDATARREAARSFYGIARTDLYREICKRWHVRNAPAAVRDPVQSDVPVLMLDGTADPVAPYWLGAEAVRHLSNGRQILIAHGGHDLTGACVDSLIADFVRTASAARLDANCAAQHVRPPFIVP